MRGALPWNDVYIWCTSVEVEITTVRDGTGCRLSSWKIIIANISCFNSVGMRRNLRQVSCEVCAMSHYGFTCWSAQPGRVVVGNRLRVVVGAGSMMSADGAAVRFPHRWIGGVTLWKPITAAIASSGGGLVLRRTAQQAAGNAITPSGHPAVGGFTRQPAIHRHSRFSRSQFCCPSRSTRPPSRGGGPGGRDPAGHPGRSHRPPD